MSESVENEFSIKRGHNHMDLLRAYARLMYWTIEFAAGRVDERRLYFQMGYTNEMVRQVVQVKQERLEWLFSNMFIGSLSGKGEEDGTDAFSLESR
jgi:hypothetical protein